MNVFEWSFFVYFFYYIISYGFFGVFREKIYSVEIKLKTQDKKIGHIPLWIFPHAILCCFCFTGWASIFLQFFHFNVILLGAAPINLIIDYILVPEKYKK